MRKSVLIVAGVLAFGLGSATVHAGATFLEAVYMDSSRAEGTVYQTRVTQNSVEKIYCGASSGSSLVGNAFCAATNSAGTYHVCYASSETDGNIMLSANSTSYIAFYWGGNGYCNYVSVYSGSWFYTP